MLVVGSKEREESYLGTCVTLSFVVSQHPVRLLGSRVLHGFRGRGSSQPRVGIKGRALGKCVGFLVVRTVSKRREAVALVEFALLVEEVIEHSGMHSAIFFEDLA